MKNKVHFFAILFLTISSFAQLKTPPTPPPQFEGTFTLKPNGIAVGSVKHEVTIFLLNQEAQKFVAKLRSQNYACVNTDGRHVNCSRFLKDFQTIGNGFEDVYRKYQMEQLEIFPSDSRAELVNEAEYLTEWKLSQNAKWMGQKFTDLHYAVIKDPTQPQELVKMKFANDMGQNAYFYVQGHPGGTDIVFQHKEILKLAPTEQFVLKDVMNCLLEVHLTQ